MIGESRVGIPAFGGNLPLIKSKKILSFGPKVGIADESTGYVISREPWFIAF